jgi:hypothetical protein
MPPVYFFVIDVSAGAVASGMVAVVASAIKGCLDQLPGERGGGCCLLWGDGRQVLDVGWLNGGVNEEGQHKELYQ